MILSRRKLVFLPTTKLNLYAWIRFFVIVLFFRVTFKFLLHLRLAKKNYISSMSLKCNNGPIKYPI